jgi:hypothetical protein
MENNLDLHGSITSANHNLSFHMAAMRHVRSESNKETLSETDKH